MRAAVLREFSNPFCIEERVIPEISTGEVLVKIAACGICGTDVKLWHGKKPEVCLPRVIGHEIAGVIAACAPDVTDFQPGCRGVVYFYNSCHKCEFCNTNRESLCENMDGRLGFTLDGGMEEYIAVRAENFLKVADNVRLQEACIVSDAIATAYRGLQKTGIKKGDHVLVVGLGGLGIHAAQVATALGGDVIGIDINPQKLEFAKHYHLNHPLLFSQTPAETVQDIMSLSGGIDIVVETVNRPETLDIDLQVLRPSGHLLMLGYGLPTVEIPPFPIVRNEITISGSRGSTRQDIQEVLMLISQGKIVPAISQTYPLEEITTALTNLEQGFALGRQVVVLDPDLT